MAPSRDSLHVIMGQHEGIKARTCQILSSLGPAGMRVRGKTGKLELSIFWQPQKHRTAASTWHCLHCAHTDWTHSDPQEDLYQDKQVHQAVRDMGQPFPTP